MKTYSSTGSNIVWDQVLDNSGHGYDLSTGRVTAPFTGRYYFAVTTVSPNEDRANVDIIVKDVMLCRVMSAVPKDVGSCQGVRQMSAGDQAWVQTYNGTNTFKANASSFTGFFLAGKGDVSRVSFTARMTSNKIYTKNQNLTWDQALDNQGLALNLPTGTFTAPVTGQYFFALSIASPVFDMWACADIKANNVTVCRVCACNRIDCRSLGSCQATVSMTARGKVWVDIFHNNGSFMAEVSTFSGFHVSEVASISFTATLIEEGKYSTDGERVVWDRITGNTGGGYNISTGHFTAAPLSPDTTSSPSPLIQLNPINEQTSKS